MGGDRIITGSEAAGAKQAYPLQPRMCVVSLQSPEGVGCVGSWSCSVITAPRFPFLYSCSLEILLSISCPTLYPRSPGCIWSMCCGGRKGSFQWLFVLMSLPNIINLFNIYKSAWSFPVSLLPLSSSWVY